MTEFVKLISKVIFASQDWHGGDAVSLLEAPERHIQRFDGQEIDIAVPYRYSRCCPPEEAEMLYLLNAFPPIRGRADALRDASSVSAGLEMPSISRC